SDETHLNRAALTLRNSFHFSHTHTHTSTRPLSCTTHPHTHKNIIYFFALSTPAAQDHFSLFTFLLDTDTVKIIALCTIGSDPFLYLETHYVLPMCMYM